MTENLHLFEHYTQVNIYLTLISGNDYIQKYNIYSPSVHGEKYLERLIFIQLKL